MHVVRSWAVWLVLLFAAAAVPAQTAPVPSAPSPAFPENPCGVAPFATGVVSDVATFGRGLKSTPRDSVRGYNLKWELPVAAATGLLIAEGDVPVANHNQDLMRQQTAGRWSNIGIGVELGSAGLAYLIGCTSHNEHLSTAGLKALDSAGIALMADFALKAMFNREYPQPGKSGGEFWEGGKSFPSGHSAVSWAFASAIAHEYPHKRWVKWGAYALATGVSLSRIPAKKHFPSDVLVGSVVGYVTGAYIASH